MEKMKRLQNGEDVSDLLAEIDDEIPTDEESEEDEDPEEYGLTEVQKKVAELDSIDWQYNLVLIVKLMYPSGTSD